jgi:hypothetical protein
MTPTESPAEERLNSVIAGENELDRLTSRLESSLEAALTCLRDRDYAGVASEIEGVVPVAEHLDELNESLRERRAALEPPDP